MGKFDKYFIQQTKGNPLHATYLPGEPSYTDWPIWIDSEAATSSNGPVEGATHYGPHLVMRPFDGTNLRPHSHDVDEWLLFHGLDPEHPEELGGDNKINGFFEFVNSCFLHRRKKLLNSLAQKEEFKQKIDEIAVLLSEIDISKDVRAENLSQDYIYLYKGLYI